MARPFSFYVRYALVLPVTTQQNQVVLRANVCHRWGVCCDRSDRPKRVPFIERDAAIVSWRCRSNMQSGVCQTRRRSCIWSCFKLTHW